MLILSINKNNLKGDVEIMFKKAQPLFIYTETSTRVGSGSDLGYVDLPIQRERHSGFPKFEASSLKGSLRSVFESDDKLKDMVKYTFGPEDGDLYAGGLGFMDSRILLFPIKSVKGIFAWVTCPYILSRFREEMLLCNEYEAEALNDIESIEPNSVTQNTELKLKARDGRGAVILEEYQFQVKEDKVLTQFSKWLANALFPNVDAYGVFREKMQKDIMVISDDAFRDFTELSTEVITRTRIDPDKGVVKQGHLFNEEYVPENTVFYSLALASSLFGEKSKLSVGGKSDEDIILEYFFDGIERHDIIQIGGNATIGKGIVRIGAMKGVN